METPGSHFPASCSFLGVADPKIRYYIDPETDEPHFFNHQVDCNEVDEVLATSTEDRPSRDGTRMALGQTANGRHLKVIYVRDSRDSSLFRHYCLSTHRKSAGCLQTKAAAEEQKMKNDFPPGWNQTRVQNVIKQYEEQTEDEAVKEDEAFLDQQRSTWMEIPLELVPAVREILSKQAS